MNQFNDNTNFLDIEGFVNSLTEEPSFTPRKLSDTFFIVTTGGSSRFYVFDVVSRTWKTTVIS